jgi:hypothetical protein
MDQLYVQKFGQDTPIPSMQLSIEPVDQSGRLRLRLRVRLHDTISWAAPDEPLPMIRDPRMVLRAVVRRGRHRRKQRAERRATDRSISTC